MSRKNIRVLFMFHHVMASVVIDLLNFNKCFFESAQIQITEIIFIMFTIIRIDCDAFNNVHVIKILIRCEIFASFSKWPFVRKM